MRISIHKRARQDIGDAARYYNMVRRGWGRLFSVRVRESFASIRNFPSASREVEQGVRVAALKQFPFKVFYRPTADFIEVIAVVHSSRDPDTWMSRA